MTRLAAKLSDKEQHRGTEDQEENSSPDQSRREEKMDLAVQLLTDIYRLLQEYAPVWYSPTTEKSLRAAIIRTSRPELLAVFGTGV